MAISIVVPARDEATRIGPLLAAVVGAPGVAEVIVVDDESTDGTADVARAGGATVVTGEPLPAGWAGKAWALQQGLDAASGDWVVFLDADTRPSPELPGSLVARMIADDLDRAHRRWPLRLPDHRGALAAPGVADARSSTARHHPAQPIPDRCTGGWATVSASPPGAAC